MTGAMECTVFYERWQMECCGKPFTVGDTVRWFVEKNIDLTTAIDVGKIDYCYEAHSSEWRKLHVLAGRVCDLKILYENFERIEENSPMMKRVDGKLVESNAVNGSEDNVDGMEATGYVVRLQEFTVRAAKKSEVTFC